MVSRFWRWYESTYDDIVGFVTWLVDEIADGMTNLTIWIIEMYRPYFWYITAVQIVILTLFILGATR